MAPHFVGERMSSRIADRPQKQLLWLWMEDLFAESGHYTRGLDIACGEMAMRLKFKTKEYIGVDADAQRLKQGTDTYNVQGIVAKIEEMDQNLRGDFVVCLQTIGFNVDFEIRNSIIAIEKCIAATRADGMLVVNVGFRAANHFSQIDAVLRRNFEELDVRTYGALRKRRNPRFSYLLASAMYRAPSLATLTKDLNKLFICRGKTPSHESGIRRPPKLN